MTKSEGTEAGFESDCFDIAAAAVDEIKLDEDTLLDPAEQRAIEQAVSSDEFTEAIAGGGLGAKGGGWGGAGHPVNRAQAIGRANALKVTSRKRSSGSTGSDHHVSQRGSDAVDLSNGQRPTPQMDRTVAQLAKLLGRPGFRAGVLNVSMNGYRVQVIYRTDVGGNHFNHVHVGVRVL